MSNDVKKTFDAIGNYFQSIADILEDEKKCSEVFPNPTDSGSIRESVLKDFLIRHLPKRCDTISGGFIIDSNGKQSKQLDLIIINDLTLQFKQFEAKAGKSYAAIEGCYAIVSVKSTLTKEKLFECLDEFGSIPDMPPLNLNPTLKADPSLVEQIPLRCIFAFSGLQQDTLIDHMNEYWKTNPTIPSKRPVLTIINNQCVIEKTGSKGGELSDGRKIAPHTFLKSERTKLGGYGLWRMINLVQEAAILGSHMIFNFNKYHNKMLDSF